MAYGLQRTPLLVPEMERLKSSGEIVVTTGTNHYIDLDTSLVIGKKYRLVFYMTAWGSAQSNEGAVIISDGSYTTSMPLAGGDIPTFLAGTTGGSGYGTKAAGDSTFKRVVVDFIAVTTSLKARVYAINGHSLTSGWQLVEMPQHNYNT